MAKTIGHAAYSKFAEVLPYPQVVARWEDLHPGTRRKWEAIALAAVNQHIDDGLDSITERLDAEMGESGG